MNYQISMASSFLAPNKKRVLCEKKRIQFRLVLSALCIWQRFWNVVLKFASHAVWTAAQNYDCSIHLMSLMNCLEGTLVPEIVCLANMLANDVEGALGVLMDVVVISCSEEEMAVTCTQEKASVVSIHFLPFHIKFTLFLQLNPVAHSTHRLDHALFKT